MFLQWPFNGYSCLSGTNNVDILKRLSSLEMNADHLALSKNVQISTSDQTTQDSNFAMHSSFRSSKRDYSAPDVAIQTEKIKQAI